MLCPTSFFMLARDLNQIAKSLREHRNTGLPYTRIITPWARNLVINQD